MTDRNIEDHMTKKLTDVQMDDVLKVMVGLCKKEGLDPTKLRNDSKLHAKMYPKLVERDAEWQGLENNIEWVGSEAHKHFKWHVKNLLRDQGEWLANQVNPPNKAVADDHDDESAEDEQEEMPP